jgi:16S rRNA processing protein RimM
VDEPPRFFAIAHLLRPRGNKGELAAELLTDFPERLTKIQQVFLSDAKNSAAPRAVAVKNFWLNQNHRGQAVFHFENVNSINDAEKLRGLDVLLPMEQRVTLPPGRYFVSDLVGCSRDAATRGSCPAGGTTHPACRRYLHAHRCCRTPH